jgi:WD40 repeat protein
MRVTRLTLPRILISLALAAGVILAGCSSLPLPTAFATHPAPNIVIPTGTPRPTETSTPTEVALSMQGTPVPPPPKPITSVALNKLKRLVSWGKGTPQAMTWSKDMHTLLVGTTAGLAFFDASNLSLIRFVERNVAVRSVAYSPSGRQMAVGFQDGSVEIWDTAYTIMASSRTPASGQPVIALAFSQDGNRLAASVWNNIIYQYQISHLFDAKPAVASEPTLTGFGSPVSSMRYNSDTSLLYTFRHGAPINVMRAGKSVSVKTFNVSNDDAGSAPLNAVFSPDLNWFVANYGSTIRIQRLSDGIVTSTLGPFSDTKSSITISPDSSMVAAASNTTIDVWKTADGTPVKSFAIPNTGEPAQFLTFSQDGNSLAAFSDTLRVWQMTSDKPLEAKTDGFITGYRGAFNFTSDSSGVMLAQLNGTVRVYGMPDGALKVAQNLPDMGSKGMAISPDGSMVAAIADNKAYVWKTSDGQQVAAMDGQRAMSGGLAFSPDSKYLAAPGQDNTIVVWRMSDQTILGTIPCPSMAWNVTFSPDGALLAADMSNVIALFQLSDGKMRYQVNGYSLAFSADGKTMAVAGGYYNNSRITIYNSADGKPKIDFASDGGPLAFSPDGKLLAVGGSSLLLVRTSDGKRLKSLSNPAPYGPLVFSRDGKLLGTTGWNGQVYIWGEE